MKIDWKRRSWTKGGGEETGVRGVFVGAHMYQSGVFHGGKIIWNDVSVWHVFLNVPLMRTQDS